MTTHNDESLKPCPFCGGKAAVVSIQFCEDGVDTYVKCSGCDARSAGCEGAYSNPSYAVQEWNRRAEQPQPAPMQVDGQKPISELTELGQMIVKETSIPYIGLVADLKQRIAELESALASRAEHAVPEGYKLVPIEPNADIIINMAAAHEFSQFHDLEGPMKDAYAAMIAAVQSNKEVER